MKYLFLLLMVMLTEGLNAQSVIVMNERTGVPVPHVVLYDSLVGHTSLTDILGRADLSMFGKDDHIYFRHPSFEIAVYLRQAIPDTVYLAEKVVHTEQVVISANKWEQDLSAIPQDIVTVEDVDIRFRNPPTSADLLAQSGEIFVQKSQLGGGSPSLRGFAANSVLLVFDGVRMNNAIFRSGNLQNVISIDPLALEGVEILMGSGSVIYGSDALGGVMDFHSRDPEPGSMGEFVLQPDFLVRYASAADEKTIHGSLEAGGKNWGSFTSVSYNDYGDLQTGSQRDDEYPDYGRYPFRVERNADGTDEVVASDPSLQEPTGYEAFSILQKIRYRPDENLDLIYSFYHNQTSDVPRFDRLIETRDNGLPVFAEWYYGPQRWTMHSLRATWQGNSDLFDRLRILPAYQRYEESRYDRRFSSPSRRAQEEMLDIFSLNLDADKSLSNKTDLYYGLETVTNKVESSAYRENIDDGSLEQVTPRYPDEGSHYTSAAAYGSLTHFASENVILSGGLRYTRVWLNASTSDSDASALGARDVSINNGAFSGNAGINWKASGRNTLSLLFSTGFRAPNVDDVGKVFELDGNDLIIPNDDLEPEYTYNTEASWRFEHNGLSLETTAFYTYLRNAIVRGPVQLDGMDSVFYNDQFFRLFAQVNAGEADIYGISFRGSYQFSKQLGIRGTFNLTTGEERDSGEPLRHTTPAFGTLTATWLLGSVKLEGWMEYNGNRFRADIPTSEIDSKPYLYAMHRSDRSLDGSPGWYTLNLRGSWQITPEILMQAGLENLLDRHYRPYSSGISAPGRNIILSLRFSPRL